MKARCLILVKLKNLHNIKKSLKGLRKHQDYLLSSIKTFRRYYHISNQTLALKLYLECKRNINNLPKSDKTPFSRSTAADLVPNMKCKTQVVDLATVSHYLYNDFSEKKISSLATCGHYLHFAMGKDKNGNRHHKLMNYQSAFCDFKYCPNRQHHYAKLRSKAIYTQIRYLYNKYNWIPIFITLTTPPTKATPVAVRKAIRALARSWKRMAKMPRYNGDNRFNKENKGIIKGWILKTEHTYNNQPYTKAYGKLHYHLHIIAFVRKSYLKSKYYVQQKQWLKDWRTSTNDKSIMGVSVEAPYYISHRSGKKITLGNARNKKQRKSIFKHASKEIAKYTGKATDYGKMPKLHKKLNRKNLNKKALNMNDRKAVTPAQIKGVQTHYYHKYHEKISSREARNIFNNLTYQTPSNRLKHNRKYLVHKSMNRRQLLAVKAFHAVVNGEKNQKLIRFGGWCARSNDLYKAGFLQKYEPENDKSEVIYSFSITSKYLYKYHDYEDYKAPLSDNDMLDLVSSGCMVDHKKLTKERKLNEKRHHHWIIAE